MNEHRTINIVPAYIKTIIGIIAAFYVFCFLFFGITFICYFGWNENMQSNLGQIILLCLMNPLNIFRTYALCFDLLQDLQFAQKSGLIFLFITLCYLLLISAKNFAQYNILGSYQTVFAKESEIRYARLFTGDFHFVGTAYNKPLRLPFNNSVLSFTDKDSINPVTIATPSIFNDNDCNMVIIDCSGNFQKLTAGYRGLLGKTLCFDWENQNEKTEGNFLPEWNPLAKKMLPEDEDAREKYISTLASSILSTQKPADNSTSLYLQCIIKFFIAKTEKATANDYFLNTLLRNKFLDDDDRALLMSYYLMMPDDVVADAKDDLTEGNLSPEKYVPVGSWENITEAWQGKDLSLPMIYDSLLQNFSTFNALPEAEKEGLWKIILQQYKTEAELFNYPENIQNILSSLAEQTTLESDTNFNMILEGLSVFKNQLIREKTVFSDFTYDEIRGFSVDDSIYPMTMYLSARTEDEKHISKIMLNMLINEAIEKYDNQNPVIFVIDDTQDLGYIHALNSGIGFGERANVSFLVFNNDINKFKSTYGEKTSQDMLQNVDYILLAADTKEKLKNLLAETTNSYTQDYLSDMSQSVDKLAAVGDDNAILILNNETPLFIQTQLLTPQQNASLFEDSIVATEPYIDEFIKAARPAFFETFTVPKVYTEKAPAKRGRKKKSETDKKNQSIEEWWLDDASFLPKKTDTEA